LRSRQREREEEIEAGEDKEGGETGGGGRKVMREIVKEGETDRLGRWRGTLDREGLLELACREM
jgi:hypothetical protein